MTSAGEHEIRIGETRMVLGEDNILHVTIVGKQDKEIARAMVDALMSFFSMVEGKLTILADNSRGKKPTREARDIFREFSAHPKMGKVAVVGMNPVARVMSAFIIGLSSNRDMRIFKTEEEALAWLKV